MNVKELTEKKNDLITRAEETLNKAKEEKRELTDAEMAELAEIRDNVRKIVKALDLDEFFDRIDKKPKEEAKPLGGEEMKTEEEVRKEKEVSRVLLVGDSLTSDIKGAVDAGIPCAWLRHDITADYSAYQPDFIIDDISQVEDLL